MSEIEKGYQNEIEKAIREQLSNAVKASGQYLIDNADKIVNDIPLIAGLEIRFYFPGGGDEFPQIEIKHEYADRKIFEAYYGQKIG